MEIGGCNAIKINVRSNENDKGIGEEEEDTWNVRFVILSEYLDVLAEKLPQNQPLLYHPWANIFLSKTSVCSNQNLRIV